MALPSIVKRIAGALFVLSLPVLFGTISLRWLVSDTGWLRAGFENYNVSARTGISPRELASAADQISSYLLLGRDRVDDIAVTIRNQPGPLFNDREVRHMADVQNLLRGFYGLQWIAAGYALLYLLVSRQWLRGGYRADLGGKLRWGGGLTLGLFGVFGVLSILDFDRLFLQFHLISFDNDLWQLDPTKDNLIMMFPQGFWYDSAIRLAKATSVQALVAIVAGSLIVRRSAVSGQRSAVSGHPRKPGGSLR